MSHPTHVKGTRAEAIVLADLIKHGYHVLTPFSGHAPYDLVAADERHRLSRIQVKFRRAKDGVLSVPLRRHHINSKGIVSKPIERDHLDGFAIYCPDNEKIYYVPMQALRGVRTSLSLRLNPARPVRGSVKGKRRRQSRMAEDFRDPSVLFGRKSRNSHGEFNIDADQNDVSD